MTHAENADFNREEISNPKINEKLEKMLENLINQK